MAAVAKDREIVALILAPDSRGLQPLFGIPAVRRVALLAGKVGSNSVHIVGRATSLRPVLKDLLPGAVFHPLEDPTPATRIFDAINIDPEARILVLMAHHVIDFHSLSRFVKKARRSGFFYLESSEHPGQGVYLGSRSDLGPIVSAMWSGAPVAPDSLEKAVRMEEPQGMPHRVKEGAGGVEVSEGSLMAALSGQTEADDGFMARHFDRFLSRFISRGIAHTSISPNQITLCGFVIGLLSAFLLSRPGYWIHLSGALAFLFCILIDGVDGEIARLKLMESRFGHYLDIVTDNVVHVAVFYGIALGLYHDSGNPAYLRLFGMLMGGFALCAIAVYQCILKRSPRELERSLKLLRLLSLLANRDFAYLIVLLAAVGRLNWFFVGTAAGAYLFAASLWAVSFYEKRAVVPKAR